MLRLYDSRLSGNSWKIRILLSQLGLAYERVTLDLQKGETREPAFGQISRFSRVPVLVLDDGRPIVESGAILLHLAQGTPYLPDDPYLRAEVMSWLRSLGLPDRIGAFDLDQAKLPEVARLLKKNYPNEVADLGNNASVKLDALLESLW